MYKKTLVIIAILLLIAGGVYYYNEQKKDRGVEDNIADTVEENAEQIDAAMEELQEVVSDIPEIDISEAVKSPVEDLPAVNPYEDAANPFEEGYTNPFE